MHFFCGIRCTKGDFLLLTEHAFLKSTTVSDLTDSKTNFPMGINVRAVGGICASELHTV